MLRPLIYTCAVFLSLVASTVDAHPIMVDACFKGTAPTVKMGEVPHENGLLSELYDRNGDGKIDIETLTPIKGIEIGKDGQPVYVHDGHPLFFLVDTKMDKQEHDTVYVDRYGKGQCSGIVTYKDLTKPTMPDKDHRDAAQVNQ